MWLCNDGTYKSWLKRVKSEKSHFKRLQSTISRYYTIDFRTQKFYYSHSETQRDVSGAVDFKDILGAELVKTSTGAPSKQKKMAESGDVGFRVRCTIRTYELRAPNADMAGQWVELLNSAKDFAAGDGSFTRSPARSMPQTPASSTSSSPSRAPGTRNGVSFSTTLFERSDEDNFSDEERPLSFAVAGWVAIAAARLRFQALKRRYLMGVEDGPPSRIFNHPDRRIHPPPLPPPAYDPPPQGPPTQTIPHSKSSRLLSRDEVRDLPLSHPLFEPSEHKSASKQSALARESQTPLSNHARSTTTPESSQSSVRFSPDTSSKQRLPHSAARFQTDDVQAVDADPSLAPRPNPLAAVSEWFAKFVGSHVIDIVAVFLCAYAAGHIGRPTL